MKPILILILLLAPACAASAQDEYDFLLKKQQEAETATVQEVVSADTIIISSYAKKGERVKLLGLKAPEPPDKKKAAEKDKFGFTIKPEITPEDPLEEQALRFTKEMLEGKTVRLEFDRYKTDENFVSIAYVFIEETGAFANAEILRQGYANLSLDPRNRKYETELRDAYQEARREKRGLQGQ